MKTIRIAEEVRLPGTNVILEKGDRVQVLNESLTYREIETFARKVMIHLGGITSENIDHEAEDIGFNLGDELSDAFKVEDIASGLRRDFIQGLIKGITRGFK